MALEFTLCVTQHYVFLQMHVFRARAEQIFWILFENPLSHCQSWQLCQETICQRLRKLGVMAVPLGWAWNSQTASLDTQIRTPSEQCMDTCISNQGILWKCRFTFYSWDMKFSISNLLPDECGCCRSKNHTLSSKFPRELCVSTYFIFKTILWNCYYSLPSL